MRKVLSVAFAIASFGGVQSALADCRNEFKDCSIRKGSSTAALSSCTKALSACQLHVRQEGHQVAKAQHDVVAAPRPLLPMQQRQKLFPKQSSKYANEKTGD